LTILCTAISLRPFIDSYAQPLRAAS
jgi:hypothetical protein